MTEPLKITPGEWRPVKTKAEGHDYFEVHYSEDGECVSEVTHGEGNAILTCDAGNTYQKDPTLPSDLLRQRDEAVAALSDLMDDIKPMNFPERDWRNGYADMKKRGIGSRTMPSEEAVMKALTFLNTLTK